MKTKKYKKFLNGLQARYEPYTNMDPTSTNGLAANEIDFKCKPGYIL